MRLLLTKKRLAEGVEFLCSKDAHLNSIVERLGAPPQWYRKPGFRTLLYLILEQQVSLASARAIWNKLIAFQQSEPNPVRFLKLTDEELRSIGFSRQKIRYGRLLSETIISGKIKLDQLQRLDDADVHAKLTSITGIGRWTADVYMMEAMRRADIWPVGDLALVASVTEVLGLQVRPNEAALEIIGAKFKPWRSVAARIFWNHYLSKPARKRSIKPT